KLDKLNIPAENEKRNEAIAALMKVQHGTAEEILAVGKQYKVDIKEIEELENLRLQQQLEIIKSYKEIANEIQGILSDGIYEIIKGTGTWRDILQDISDNILKRMLDDLLEDVKNAFLELIYPGKEKEGDPATKISTALSAGGAVLATQITTALEVGGTSLATKVAAVLGAGAITREDISAVTDPLYGDSYVNYRNAPRDLGKISVTPSGVGGGDLTGSKLDRLLEPMDFAKDIGLTDQLLEKDFFAEAGKDFGKEALDSLDVDKAGMDFG
ncbi:unnamed protein product, partial [marine sediment metagenome]